MRMARQEALAVPLIILQTLAANLGSMLTPMGNPQNCTSTRSRAWAFCSFAASCCLTCCSPPSAWAARCFCAGPGRSRRSPWKPARPRKKPRVVRRRPAFVPAGHLQPRARPRRRGGDPRPRSCSESEAAADRGLRAARHLRRILHLHRQPVDHPELPELPLRHFAGHVVPVSVLASQVISNVPAALLLSGFTSDWSGLLIGTNLGGLGTLIASMASLISYKQLAREFPERRSGIFSGSPCATSRCYFCCFWNTPCFPRADEPPRPAVCRSPRRARRKLFWPILTSAKARIKMKKAIHAKASAAQMREGIL